MNKLPFTATQYKPPRGIESAYLCPGRLATNHARLFLRDDCRAALTFLTGEFKDCEPLLLRIIASDANAKKAVLICGDGIPRGTDLLKKESAQKAIPWHEVNLPSWSDPLPEQALPPSVVADILATSLLPLEPSGGDANRLRGLIALIVRRVRSTGGRLNGVQFLSMLSDIPAAAHLLKENADRIVELRNGLPDSLRRQFSDILAGWPQSDRTPAPLEWLKQGGVVQVNNSAPSARTRVYLRTLLAQVFALNGIPVIQPALSIFLVMKNGLEEMPSGILKKFGSSRLLLWCPELPSHPPAPFHEIRFTGLRKGRKQYAYRPGPDGEDALPLEI